MAVLVLAILLFIFEWVRVDVVGIIMMITLPLLGLVTPKEAISGLSSNAVVSIIAVIIIGAGLDKTGAMNHLARIILKFAGKSESRIMVLISGTVAFISSFMQNIGAAALFMPVSKRICRQTNIPVSRILMPMGFCAIIGGCITLIGSSPLILLNDVMKISAPEIEPFGLFSVTPVGVSLIIAALVYFVVLGRFILPAGEGEAAGSGPMSKELARTYHDIGNLFELQVPDSFKGPKTLEELEIRPIFFTTILAIATKGGLPVSSPDYSDTIKGVIQLPLKDRLTWWQKWLNLLDGMSKRTSRYLQKVCHPTMPVSWRQSLPPAPNWWAAPCAPFPFGRKMGLCPWPYSVTTKPLSVTSQQCLYAPVMPCSSRVHGKNFII